MSPNNASDPPRDGTASLDGGAAAPERKVVSPMSSARETR